MHTQMDRKRKAVGLGPPPPPATGGPSKTNDTVTPTPKAAPVKQSLGRTPQPTVKGSLTPSTTTPLRGIRASTSNPKQPISSTPVTTTTTTTNRTRGIKPVPTMGKKPVVGSRPTVRSKLLDQPTSSAPMPTNEDISKLRELLALQNDIVSYKETLAERNVKLGEQQVKLHSQDDIIKNLQADQVKSNMELSDLKNEISSMNKLLNDEVLTRIKLQSEARRREDLEHEQVLKLSQLEAEAALKEEEIKKKKDVIREQEECISLLKKLACANSSTSKVFDDKVLNLSNNSKKCRLSISTMQTNLSKNFDEVERRFNETTSSLRSELDEVVKKNLDLTEAITAKDIALQQLQGRLEESRQAIEEKVDTDAKSKSSQDSLHCEVVTLTKKIGELEAELEHERLSSLQVDLLEGQLMQMTRMNRNLTAKVESLEETSAEFQSWMQEKEKYCDEMERKVLAQHKTIVQVDKEVQCALDTQLTKSMDNDVPCSSDLMEPVVQLEAQLADAVKSLTLKEEQFIGLEKDFSITKADLHLAHCENIEVTEKNSQLIQENAVYSKEIEVYKRYAQIYQDSKSEIVELKETLAKKEEQLVSLTKNVNEEMEKVRLSEIQHNQLTEVCNGKAKCLEIEVKRLEEQLRQTTNVLEEKACKVESQRLSLALLREATTIQEEQLKKFEDSYSAQITELEQLEADKKSLRLEVLTLQEDLSRVNSMLEESKSRETILEGRIKNGHLARFTFETTAHKEIKALEKNVEDLSLAKAEISQTLRRVQKELDKANLASESSQRLVEALEKDNDTCTDEIVELSRRNTELSKEIGVLREEIGEIIERSDDFKNRYEALTSRQVNQESMDLEVFEENLKLKVTIRQQSKLIDFLQVKNQHLLKKKEKKFQLFGKGSMNRGDENVSPPPQCTSREDLKAWSARYREAKPTPTLTPVNLIREHFHVQELEKTRDSLRTKLASLQEGDAGKCQASSLTNISPKKEDCLLLKTKEGTN